MRDQKGIAFFIALMVTVVTLALGAAFLSFAVFEHTVAKNHVNLARSFWLAEAGLAHGYKQVTVNRADAVDESNLGGGTYSYTTAVDIPEDGLVQIWGVGRYDNTLGQVVAVYKAWSLGAGALNIVSGPGGISPTFNGESLYISDIAVTDDDALAVVDDAISPGQNIPVTATGAPDLEDVLDLAAQLQRVATVRLEGNVNTDIGSETRPVVAWASGDVNLAGPATGYGVLLVDGSANIRGSLSWYGLVLVVGEGDLASPGLSGVADIHGQVIVASSAGTTNVTVAGNTRITLDPQDFVEGLIGLRQLSWRQVQ